MEPEVPSTSEVTRRSLRQNVSQPDRLGAVEYGPIRRKTRQVKEGSITDCQEDGEENESQELVSSESSVHNGSKKSRKNKNDDDYDSNASEKSYKSVASNASSLARRRLREAELEALQSHLEVDEDQEKIAIELEARKIALEEKKAQFAAKKVPIKKQIIQKTLEIQREKINEELGLDDDNDSQKLSDSESDGEWADAKKNEQLNSKPESEILQDWLNPNYNPVDKRQELLPSTPEQELTISKLPKSVEVVKQSPASAKEERKI